MLKKILTAAVCAALCLGTVGCQKRVKIEPADGWYCTWAAAPLESEAEQVPRAPILSGNTCRQQLRVSIGGSKIRLSFSNEYSDSAMTLESVHIAKLRSPGSPEIYPDTDTPVTFGGEEKVKISAGGTVTSDEISFEFSSLDYLAVTTKFGSVPVFPTCHREADCTTWIVEGDQVSAESFSTMGLSASWYGLCRLDTWAPAGTETLVCFGDSISDGACSTFNGFDSWPDNLSKAMQSDPATSYLSVVNTSIAGNAIHGGWGTPALERFERDVLDIPGVHHVIILIGTNDIPGAQYDTTEDFKEDYKAMIKLCHERGIKIYGGTITPFGGNETWYSELHEKIRKSVNEWIMSPDSGFDGFIDFASVTSYAERPQMLQTVYDSGDGLHPNASGYDVMGKAAAEEMNKLLRREEE